MLNLFQKFKIWGLATIIILFGFSFAQEILAAPTWTNGIVPQSGGRAGGGALEFDGNDFVDIKDVGNIQTVEFWVNDTNATDGILELINNSTYISIAASAITATGFTSPTIYVNGSSASAVLSSGWNHVVVTTNTAVAAASFLIGEANGDYMSGTIDEVRVYNRALSAEEVRYHYNRGGPVAQWPFDSGSGSVLYDKTESNNDGTLYLGTSGNTATSSAWVAGKSGSALSFDGVDDYVQVPDSSSLDVTTDFTLGVWVKRASFGAVSHYIYDHFGTGNVGITLSFTDSPQNKLLVELGDGTTYTYNSNSTITDTKWHYVVVAYSSSQIRFYIDGILDISQSAISSISVATNPARIGSYHGTSSFFNGLIDDVRLYNYARTPSQILQDYNFGFSARFR